MTKLRLGLIETCTSDNNRSKQLAVKITDERRWQKRNCDNVELSTDYFRLSHRWLCLLFAIRQITVVVIPSGRTSLFCCKRKLSELFYFLFVIVNIPAPPRFHWYVLDWWRNVWGRGNQYTPKTQEAPWPTCRETVTVHGLKWCVRLSLTW